MKLVAEISLKESQSMSLPVPGMSLTWKKKKSICEARKVFNLGPGRNCKLNYQNLWADWQEGRLISVVVGARSDITILCEKKENVLLERNLALQGSINPDC